MDGYLDASVVTVNLSCEANGFPHPVIGWLNNNSSVRNGTVVQNGSVSMLLLVFTKETEQLQKYRCVASNSIGSTLSKEATVTISKRLPTIPGKYAQMPLSSLFTTHVYVDVPKKLSICPLGLYFSVEMILCILNMGGSKVKLLHLLLNFILVVQKRKRKHN